MDETRLFEKIKDVAGTPALQSLVRELWAVREADTAVHETRWKSTEALGKHYLEHSGMPSVAVRDVLRAGRALVEEGLQAGLLDQAGACRLSAFVDDAAVQTAQAVETARRARRQSWLSFLVHEVKNPLNTVLNALWLLREKGTADPTQASRFIDLAERAVRRLEARARDVRELDEQLTQAPAGWEAARSALSPTP